MEDIIYTIALSAIQAAGTPTDSIRKSTHPLWLSAKVNFLT